MAGHPERLTPGRRRRAAFTLIEILAVVAILALVAAFVAPNLGMLRDRRLWNEAQRLAAQIELARQRTVVTGVPHRLLLDLESHGYRVEWLGGGQAAASQPFDLQQIDLRGAAPLPLEAPENAERVEFEPIPGLFGRFSWLEEPVFLAGLDTPDGWIDVGDTFVQFSRDGSADPSEIVLEDDSGRRIVLVVLPLDDAVRFVDEEA